MIVGVRIGEIDTLSEWGLCLCSDLSIGAPELKSKWVDVPAADGALDFSQALTGGPVYKNRKITFRLVQGRSICRRFQRRACGAYGSLPW